MFKYQSVKDMLLQELKKNAALQAQLAQTSANLDYVAMMADVDIPVEEEPEDEQEV